MSPTNEPGTANSSSARFMDRFRGSAQKKTAAFRKRLSTCLKTEVDSESLRQPSSVEVQDFLAFKARMDNTQTKPMPPPQVQRRTALPRPNSEYLPVLKFDTGSSTSLGNVSELHAESLSDFSGSQVSLPSSLGAPLTVSGWDKPPHEESTTARPAETRFHIEAPEDFARYRADLQNLVELDTNPVTAQPKKELANVVELDANSVSEQPKNKTANVVELPATVNTAATVIDSTPIPVEPAIELSGEGDVKPFKAYPGVPPRKPVKEKYVVPALQAGYVGGVPPELKVGHVRQCSNPAVAVAGKDSREHYSWPLVDFREEMFLNHKPSQAAVVTPRRQRHPKHQMPRIPSMNFSHEPLDEEATAILARLEQEKREVVRPRGYASPTSPLERGRVVHEMQASIPHTSNTRGGREVANRTEGRAELWDGRTTKAPVELQATVSPVSPLTSAEKRISYQEYAWPRFSEAQRYSDPAEEYSKTWRDRRREMRRERVQQ
ncbi:hypothetical protein LTR10_022151 [Elasticomyces elasticus]|uniref:DUF4048 domain-containing protein n=1 Tax=Exophiala sideris TaxID=1016849 RepID=A0ABR0IUV2_9EURO|nr:hypothetical protein LTR10_022151 [Elasticomyces elasticus]KAK5021207.1 hypothetical protein LTS07_011203 [Exophiala sideris]KAK5023766.1 hypothetical protein LTR13_011075 [Exophiala sideris]KAK5048845.1 hypothetical protein LTR69_011190 [Exophiala sideris]KAK5176365.1 hypothetical protein LTR44_011127 [Eurotiomycetes sp. CCFEE 6388]